MATMHARITAPMQATFIAFPAIRMICCCGTLPRAKIVAPQTFAWLRCTGKRCDTKASFGSRRRLKSLDHENHLLWFTMSTCLPVRYSILQTRISTPNVAGRCGEGLQASVFGFCSGARRSFLGEVWIPLSRQQPLIVLEVVSLRSANSSSHRVLMQPTLWQGGRSNNHMIS